jgi:hypothetical protein
MTPSTSGLLEDDEALLYGPSEKKEGKQLTIAVCVRNNNVSCPKLDEKLLHKFQRRIDAYS